MSIPKINSYELIPTQDLPENKVDWQLDSNRAVLLIHDMQQYFLNFYGPDSQLIQQVVANIEVLKKACKQAGIPVVYTAQPVNQSPEERALLNDMWGPGLTTAEQEYPIVESLTPDESDKLLTKWRYSAFQRNELEGWMKSMGRDQLILCGVYTHIGVMTSAVDAFMRDIQPFLVSDATADFSKQEHEFALHFVARRCGVVLPLEVAQKSLKNAENKSVEPLSKQALLERVLAYADCDAGEFDADENLLDYGVDSAQIMELHGAYQQLGIELDLAAISENLTLNNIWSLIEKSR